MKIPAIFFVLLLTSNLASAQIERKPSAAQSDSTVKPSGKMDDKASRKDRLKDLDLTKEQRSKLKEIRQTNQAAKTAIENDAALSDTEKKKQLRDLQKKQAQQIQSILTEEQKAKFKEGGKKNS